MAGETRYWFRAKQYGWGWGLPLVWQGWVVLVAFLVLVALGNVLFSPARHIAAFMAYQALCCAALTGVCYAKGEPPKWRWGDGGRSGD